MHADLVQQRQVQVGERRRVVEADVPSTLELRAAAARDHDRQVRVIVDVGVAHAAAQQVQRVIQQRAVAVGRRRQLLDQVGEQRHVVGVDLRQLDELLRVVDVMRHGMVRLGDADVGIGAGAGLARQLEGDDARGVGLERQHLEVEHQPDVILPDRGHAGRPRQIGQARRVGLLRPLDPAFHLAHRVQVLPDPVLIAGSQLAAQPRQVGGHPVQDAAALLQFRAPALGAAAVAEQPLEDDAGIRLGRQRRRGRRPRQVVLVGAGVAVVAVAHLGQQVRADLERRQRRVRADRARGNLIDRRPQLVVAALGALRLRAAQEGAVRRGVVAGGVGVAQLQAAQHGHVIDDRRQGEERGRQRQRAFAFGRPRRGVHPHRDVDVAEPPHRAGDDAGLCRQRRHHGVEERQRQRGAHAAQERAPGKCRLRHDHCDTLI